MNSYKLKNGFTLIEIIIALGILSLIIGIGLTMDLSILKKDILKSEQSTIVTSLERARSLAMNNMFQSPHGFCYISPNYIIFRDSPSTRCVANEPTNQIIPANINISENTSTTFPSFIIFSQLSGNSSPNNIHLSDGARSLDIDISSEGAIEW